MEPRKRKRPAMGDKRFMDYELSRMEKRLFEQGNFPAPKPGSRLGNMISNRVKAANARGRGEPVLHTFRRPTSLQGIPRESMRRPQSMGRRIMSPIRNMRPMVRGGIIGTAAGLSARPVGEYIGQTELGRALRDAFGL
jgi:hypothetical protein